MRNGIRIGHLVRDDGAGMTAKECTLAPEAAGFDLVGKPTQAPASTFFLAFIRGVWNQSPVKFGVVGKSLASVELFVRILFKTHHRSAVQNKPEKMGSPVTNYFYQESVQGWVPS